MAGCQYLLRDSISSKGPVTILTALYNKEDLRLLRVAENLRLFGAEEVKPGPDAFIISAEQASFSLRLGLPASGFD